MVRENHEVTAEWRKVSWDGGERRETMRGGIEAKGAE